MIGMLIDRADLPKRFADIGELESFMARPTQELIDDLAAVPGDILVLGAGGKMGPTLSMLARHAAPDKCVVAVARFSEQGLRERLERHGIETIACDLLDRKKLARLPSLANLIFMAGRKFGSSEDESLTWVIKEIMRRYPPLPVIPRVATRGFEWAGYRVPANAMVVISPIHTHYMAEWWSEPSRFDPERFAPARAEDQRHTHAWIPFGGGPHLCLGMHFADLQIKAIMHQLLLRYRWSVPAGYTMPVQQAPISKPLDGLPIELHRI